MTFDLEKLETWFVGTLNNALAPLHVYPQFNIQLINDDDIDEQSEWGVGWFISEREHNITEDTIQVGGRFMVDVITPTRQLSRDYAKQILNLFKRPNDIHHFDSGVNQLPSSIGEFLQLVFHTGRRGKPRQEGGVYKCAVEFRVLIHYTET